jgi:hypothetical protein
MSALTIPDFWSDEIRVNVLTPLAILRAGEGSLEKKTNGLLRTEVSSTTSPDFMAHTLELIAPSLNQRRVGLLSATHRTGEVYPVLLKSRGFLPPYSFWRESSRHGDMDPEAFSPPDDEREANSQDEFTRLVVEALHSPNITALILSLIAKSNESQTKVAS